MKETYHSTDKTYDEYVLVSERQIEEFLSEMKNEEENNNERMRWHRMLSYEQFERMLIACAEKIMHNRGTYEKFIIDDNNSYMIHQMYYYFIGNQEKCAWNVDKGLYFYGAVGCGKTLLMLSLMSIINAICGIIITYIHSKELLGLIKSVGIKSIVMKPIFIDELGRESLEINEYGNKIRPIQDLFSYRYESGARTFVTSNFGIDELEGKKDKKTGVVAGYGKYVRTRIEEMMNIVKMPGENRRPKY